MCKTFLFVLYFSFINLHEHVHQFSTQFYNNLGLNTDNDLKFGRPKKSIFLFAFCVTALSRRLNVTSSFLCQSIKKINEIIYISPFQSINFYKFKLYSGVMLLNFATFPFLFYFCFIQRAWFMFKYDVVDLMSRK